MTGYLMDGGWMMLPLLVCSITLLAVIIDRVRAFRAAAKCDPVKTRREVREALEANDLDVNAPKVVRRPRKKLSDLPGQMTLF